MSTRLTVAAARRSWGASGNLIRGLEAPVHSPQEQLPALRLFYGVRPAKVRRRQRTAATILHLQPPPRPQTRANPATPATERQQPRPDADPHAPEFSRRHGVPKAPATFLQHAPRGVWRERFRPDAI